MLASVSVSSGHANIANVEAEIVAVIEFSLRFIYFYMFSNNIFFYNYRTSQHTFTVKNNIWILKLLLYE